MRVLLDPETDAARPLDLLGNTAHPFAARHACNAIRTARNEAAHAAVAADGAQAALLFNEAIEALEEGYAGTAFKENELAQYYREAEDYLSRCSEGKPLKVRQSSPQNAQQGKAAARTKPRNPQTVRSTKSKHKSPQFIKEVVYGLCEINRDKVTTQTRLIANPGCYTTCSILTAYPLVKEGLIDPDTLIIDAKSGTSGAGRGAKTPNLFCEVNESMKAYGVTTHRHTPEIEEQLGYAAGKEITVNFTPHLVPMNRGILATEYATLIKKPDGTYPSYEELKAAYDKYYAKERFHINHKFFLYKSLLLNLTLLWEHWWHQKSFFFR